ncbi:MAG: COX15/CtaA family protein [Limnohabitans sp.]|jgi:cytochrome c oxidase assembly protein subunit 15|nr:COX15/CtaA family protein [Limnohabitans sp.]
MMPSIVLTSALSFATQIDAPFATPAVAEGSPTPLGVLLAVFAVLAGLAYGAAYLVRPVHLALGFATTAAMWAIGYVSMMAPGLWIGEALFLLTLAVPVVFGAVARRANASPMVTGLVSAVANLLVIGAFLRDARGDNAWVPFVYVGGLFAISAALAWFGGFLARNATKIELPVPASLFARVAALTVFILLVTGGLVTGLESGLAVPDWPNSFGHNMLLYPISEMKEGIYYEHAHRLFGMLVGVTALMLVHVVFRDDRRQTLPRVLAVLFLAMVCVQGLFGGLRVTGTLTTAVSGTELSPSTLLAIVHGMFGQVVFATACVIACVTSRTWSTQAPFADLRNAQRLRTLPVFLVSAMLVQLFLGASYRHLQIPPSEGQPAVHPEWPIWGHIFGAFVVLVLAVVTGAHASSRARDVRPVRFFGKALMHGVGLQFVLGIGALVVVLIRTDARIPVYEVATTSVHQALGAVLLASASMLAVWSLRLVALPTRESTVIAASRLASPTPQRAHGSA